MSMQLMQECTKLPHPPLYLLTQLLLNFSQSGAGGHAADAQVHSPAPGGNPPPPLLKSPPPTIDHHQPAKEGLFAQVGMQLMRECIFLHLEAPLDKLNLLLAMLQKLYALVGGQCSEDNPDALTHHEIMLPGQLLCKFLQDKLVECLEIFKAQVDPPPPCARSPQLTCLPPPPPLATAITQQAHTATDLLQVITPWSDIECTELQRQATSSCIFEGSPPTPAPAFRLTFPHVRTRNEDVPNTFTAVGYR